jgi:hypothetical protein
VWVHAVIEKADGVFFRCTLDGTETGRFLEIPAWMFDRLLQPFHLIALQPAILIPPPIVCNFHHPYRSDRLSNWFALRCQHFNLPRLRNNLFRLMSLLWHSASSIRLKAILQGGPLSRGQTITQWRLESRRIIDNQSAAYTKWKSFWCT